MPYEIDRPERGGPWEATQIPSLARAVWMALGRIFRRRGGGVRAQAPAASAASMPRLMLMPDGSPACTACMLCVKACRSGCISVERDLSVPPEMRPRPAAFGMDMLKCTFCGACVEACPCDALRMDAGALPPSSPERASFVYDMPALVSNHPKGASPLSRAL